MAIDKFKINGLNEISGLLSSDKLLIERTIDDITSANYITPYDMLSHLHFDAHRTSTDKSART